MNNSKIISEVRIKRLEIICDYLNLDSNNLSGEKLFWELLSKHLTISITDKTIWVIAYIWTGCMPSRQEMFSHKQDIAAGSCKKWLHKLSKQSIQNLEKNILISDDDIFVDVFHTSQTELATGIQRVTRNTVSKWFETHSPLLITWDTDGKYLRTLTSKEFENCTELSTNVGFPEESDRLPILIPTNGTLVLPELVAEPWRTSRIAALIEATGIQLKAIGYDCVPVTSAETTSPGMPVLFANYLDLLSTADTICTISASAQKEYLGWRTMLAAKGSQLPDIEVCSLASSTKAVTKIATSFAIKKLGIDMTIPLVLAVGSHEPRKNHLSILRASEFLWDQGIKFQVLFVGGNAWKSGYFEAQVKRLKSQGFPISTQSAIDDSTLTALISASRFTIFPSLNEGFGLPVAESLELNVPVITSDFGSTKEISFNLGGVLISPKSDAEIKDAMNKMLTNEEFFKKAKTQTEKFNAKSWDQYSREVWDCFFKAN